MTVASSFSTAGAETETAALSDELFSDLAGASDGEPSGDSIGGAGGDETGVGASATGEGLGGTDGVREGDDTGSGAGAGDGDFPNNSLGRSMLSTVKRHSGVASSTVSATLDESTPVFRVTASPCADTVRSYFPAPLLASVLIGSLLVFNDPIGVYEAEAWYCKSVTSSALVSLVRSGTPSALKASSLGAKTVKPFSTADS